MILPDVLLKDLALVFCGTAAGKGSAEVQQYYAHPGNAFWATLHRVGLTPVQLSPGQFKELPTFGIGLTDLNKTQAGGDQTLKKEAFDIESFEQKITDINPKVLAFTSKNAAKVYFSRNNVKFGRQKPTLNKTIIWVLPSTSGLARKYWQKNEHHWLYLAHFLNKFDT